MYPKSWFWMHAFDWPEQTLKIYIQYSTYFACNNDLCSAVLANLLWDVFLSFLPHLSLEEGIWEEWQVPKVAKNLSLRACIWLARTNRHNWVQYFPCENDLCRAMVPDWLGTLSSTLCQISALKEAIGHVCLWQHHISQMGYFKCTILFNISMVPFHFYLIIINIGCTMFT